MWNIFAVYVNQKLVKNIFDFFPSKIPKIFWQPMWNSLCHFSVTYVFATYVDSLCRRSLCCRSLCGNFIIQHICNKSLTSMWIFDSLCQNSLCRAAYVVAAYVAKNEYWWWEVLLCFYLCICRIVSIWVCVVWVWVISGLGDQCVRGMAWSVGVAEDSF